MTLSRNVRVVLRLLAPFVAVSAIWSWIFGPVQHVRPSLPVSASPDPAPAEQKSYIEVRGPAPGVTMRNYSRIEPGMSYRQVVAILGKDGTEVSSNQIGDLSTVMYQWTGGFMANMHVMFQNDRMVSKAQFGLE